MEPWEVLQWLILVANACLVLSTTYEPDTTALEAISKAWQTDLGWSGEPCANNWRGVTCDNVQKTNVTKLVLNSMNIKGRLPQSIGDLQNLQTLDLSFNPDLSGSLPSRLGNLQNLVYLNLQGCGFTGSIPPELGRLKKLNFLALNLNKLSGAIPPELGGLTSCTWFDFAQNGGINGPLPISNQNAKNIGLDNLTSAVHFHLNNNSFSGSFPKEITSLPRLKHLLLDSNQFTGEIPDDIGNFSALTILRLDNNMFSGSLPSSISRISTLQEIHVRNNNLTGVIPDLTSLSTLMLLSIGQNPFDPQPVPSFSGMTNLQTIEIDEGNLGGQMPTDFFNLPILESVSFRHNQINGTVDFATASSSLIAVQLDNNKITFVILNSFPFDLSLTGNPACTDQRLSLSRRVCSTQAPQSWRLPPSDCQTICSDSKILNPNTCSCAFPLIILFQFNAPTFSSVNSSRIDILRENLSQGLKLNKDQVLADGANFTSSHRLLVNVNFFPASGLALSPENVSFIINQISTHRLDLDYYGPYALLNIVPPPGGFNVKKSGLSSGAIIGIAVAGAVVLIAIAAVSIYALKQKKRADKASVWSNPFASWGSRGKDSGTAPQLKGARFFSLADLKKATNNFRNSNEIGAGGYGKVYKGTLLTGEEVAIKRAQESSLQGGREFKTEIELLSRVHHRNLVGLIGFCYEHGEQMLVYEYMPKGNLNDLLSAHSEALTWRKRLEIAVGSARGIAYLHELADPPIIHRDIKSANILLDDKYVAKVSDFGLSKLVSTSDGKGHISTQVKGTLGYLDPEYYMSQQLTEKSDVYSFGVVLLELVTARQPIESNKYIVREVRGALDRGFSQLMSILDPSLRDYPRWDLQKFVEVALSCVEESASARPTMAEVARELEILLSNVSSSGFSKDSSRDNRHGGTSVYDDPLKDSGFQYSGGFPASLEPK